MNEAQIDLNPDHDKQNATKECTTECNDRMHNEKNQGKSQTIKKKT
jgi:hypothetical protein